MDAGVIMGQSTDAKIWFGLCWTEADEEFYENGIPAPVLAHMKAQDPDIEDEGDAERAVDKLLAPFGCELVRHCYYDGADMVGLAITESCEIASRGYPVNLTDTGVITTGTIGDEWMSKLTLAAQAIGWPWRPPAWWLASYWC
jgi:hypothetical protein